MWGRPLETACSHREAEPQEGGGIARAWIEDPKVYPGIPMMALGAWGDSGGYSRPFC